MIDWFIVITITVAFFGYLIYEMIKDDRTRNT